MVGGDGTAITFNGEIYNYVELMTELKAGWQFRSSSDTETVLAAYAAAGPDGATETEIASATRIPVAAVGRMSLWLVKYHFLEGMP